MTLKDATKFIAFTALMSVDESVTGSVTGSAKDLGAILPQQVMGVLDAKSLGGDSDETLDVIIEGSDDGSTWVTAGTFAQHTQPVAAVLERINITKNYRQYRAVATLAGATPDFAFGVYLVGADPTFAPIAQV